MAFVSRNVIVFDANLLSLQFFFKFGCHCSLSSSIQPFI